MITIGIDVGKFNHCVCILDYSTGELSEPFFFENNKEGFSLLLESIKQHLNAKHIVGLEDTGHYGNNLTRFLLENGYTVGLINPITTDAKRRSGLKSSKNDKQDSILIAKLLLDDEDYRLVDLATFALRDLRQLTRHHHTLKEELNRYTNRLQKNIDIVFPEFNTLFNAKYGITYMNILKNYSSSYTIANTDIRSLRNCFVSSGRGRKIPLTAEELKLAAKNSIGENNIVSEMEIKQLISIIELLEANILEIDKKIEELSIEQNSPITSIPGISHFSGMSILSEYGDFSRFESASKLISFAGVNPYEYQSGTYKAPHTALTKKGSRYLRKTLYQVALPLIRFNPIFHSYYTLKRSQGKSHRCAMGHVVRKLLRVIYTLVSTNQTFNPAILK